MVKIYTMNGCPFCEELKNRLTEMEIDFTEINTDLEKHAEEYKIVSEIAQSGMVPLVKIGKNLLVPDKSFNTIKEAANITKKLLKD